MVDGGDGDSAGQVAPAKDSKIPAAMTANNRKDMERAINIIRSQDILGLFVCEYPKLAITQTLLFLSFYSLFKL